MRNNGLNFEDFLLGINVINERLPNRITIIKKTKVDEKSIFQSHNKLITNTEIPYCCTNSIK